MSRPIDYGTPASQAELAELARIEGQAFNYPSADAEVWLTANRAHVRAARRDGQVVGGLVLVPMGNPRLAAHRQDL